MRFCLGRRLTRKARGIRAETDKGQHANWRLPSPAKWPQKRAAGTKADTSACASGPKAHQWSARSRNQGAREPDCYRINVLPERLESSQVAVDDCKPNICAHIWAMRLAWKDVDMHTWAKGSPGQCRTTRSKSQQRRAPAGLTCCQSKQCQASRCPSSAPRRYRCCVQPLFMKAGPGSDDEWQPSSLERRSQSDVLKSVEGLVGVYRAAERISCDVYPPLELRCPAKGSFLQTEHGPSSSGPSVLGLTDGSCVCAASSSCGLVGWCASAGESLHRK